MRLERADREHAKGWYLGAWNSDFTVAIGYASVGIHEPHVHHRITEVYMVGAGSAELRIERESLHLERGDVVVIEPREAHTFVASSPDYFHFVLHFPSLTPNELAEEREVVPGSRVGL